MTGTHASEGCTAWETDALAVVHWQQKPVEEARLTHAERQALAGCARPRLLHVEDDLLSNHRKGTANHE